ncbi:hypothetical protein 4DII_00181 [Klebsiella phage PSKm4DII]|nr:hypothetical protein 4DII_00181 [Klebsiella phage PSKm4DII]
MIRTYMNKIFAARMDNVIDQRAYDDLVSFATCQLDKHTVTERKLLVNKAIMMVNQGIAEAKYHSINSSIFSMLFDGFKLERQLVQLRKIRDLLAEGLLVLEHRVNLNLL